MSGLHDIKALSGDVSHIAETNPLAMEASRGDGYVLIDQKPYQSSADVLWKFSLVGLAIPYRTTELANLLHLILTSILSSNQTIRLICLVSGHLRITDRDL